MGTIAEKLTYLNDTKTAIKNAVVAKGVSISDADTFRSYADKIGQISGGGGTPTDEWQPNPEWWDIRKILDEDTRDYAGKIGVILYNFNDVSDFTLSSSNKVAAVATSDGAFYSYENDGANVTHHWDTTQDKDDGRGFKTRWVIYYFRYGTLSATLGQNGTEYGWAYNRIAYLVLRINLSLNSINGLSSHMLLEAIDNVGYSVSGTFFGNFCQHCYSLMKLPDVLDTSNGTNFSGFCYNCHSLQKLPDVLDTSNGTDFYNFCYNCHSLQKLPDVLDTSNGTNFSGFCSNCHSLQKLPDVLDTSNGTNFSNFCTSCSSLQVTPEITMAANTVVFTSKYSAPFAIASWIKTIYLTLPNNTVFWLDSSTRISIESFRYIADHAPDVTATPRTLTIGSTNITRCNEADPTIITDLNAKGWTVA